MPAKLAPGGLRASRVSQRPSGDSIVDAITAWLCSPVVGAGDGRVGAIVGLAGVGKTALRARTATALVSAAMRL